MALAPDPKQVPVCRRGDSIVSWDPLVLLIDKPSGITSFDVIRRLRRISPLRKIGHAGTLDPLASGLLICLCGRATKLMNHFMGQSKVYTGTMRLGETTASFDAETEIEAYSDASAISDVMLEQAVRLFTGDITQQTPIYSAVKVGGERLYNKARRGEMVNVPSRQVTVHAFEITGRSGSDLHFEIACSSGTYIRSIAHELGQKIGVGAHLVALHRSASGEFRVNMAWPLAELEAQYQA